MLAISELGSYGFCVALSGSYLASMSFCAESFVGVKQWQIIT